jgi:hypothetical protein
MPIAVICWVVTMVDNNGALTGAPMVDTLRMFKMPSMLLSVGYFILSFTAFPLFAAWLN